MIQDPGTLRPSTHKMWQNKSLRAVGVPQVSPAVHGGGHCRFYGPSAVGTTPNPGRVRYITELS